MLELSEVELKETIRQSTSKRISENRVGNLAEKLVGLVKQSYSAISKTSPIIEEVKYNAQKLIRLTSRREQVLEQLIELAKPLPEYVILLSIPGIAETTGTSVIGELETFVALRLLIKSTLLSVLISNTMSREIS